MDPRPRASISKTVETQILTTCQRRCCLCYYLSGVRTERKGQIAHLNHDSSDSSYENLVWLCLDHHDQFDSTTRQSKGLTVDEVRTHRDRLYRELSPVCSPRQKPGSSDNTTPIFVKNLSSVLKQVLDGAKGKLDWMLTPWDLMPHSDVKRFLFAYKAPNRIDGICRVERFGLLDGRVAVICTQIRDNPGMSVTNSIEAIAFQLCAQFAIDPSRLVLIDHYPGSEDLYHLVSFQIEPPKGMFAGPIRQRMTDDDWGYLRLRPRGIAKSRKGTE